MQLKDKIAYVTGAGSGIGKAAALMMAREGADVAVLSRTQSEIEQTAEEVRALGRDALAIVGDISVEEDMRDAADRIIERWGKLDIVFANAGINGTLAPFEEIALEEWNRTITINLTGTFLTLKYTVPHMKAHGAGSIIVNASINGTYLFSNGGMGAYATTKAGLVGFTKMIAQELSHFGIRANVLCTGWTQTDIRDNTYSRDTSSVRPQKRSYPIPLKGLKAASPDDIANLVLFLASDASRFITGADILIDGGETLIRG
jgi:NAD(P)-dependent dehydrogenase (short-subunit alcohol dehydrogenase family)